MRFSDLQLDFGASFVRPALPMNLPLARHPDMDQVEPLCINWVRPFLVQYFNGDATRAERYLQQRPSSWSGFCYPHTLPDRLLAVMNSMYALTMIDDAFSEPHILASLDACVQLRDDVVKLLYGGHVRADFVMGRLLRAALDQLAPGMTPAAIARSNEYITAIVDSIVAEAQARHDDVIPAFDTYLQARRINLFGYWVTLITEYALGLDLSTQLAASADLRLAIDLVIDHMILVNDIFSFAKEYETGEMMNAIWIFCAQESLSLQQAIDRVAGKLSQTEDDFIATCQRVRASQPELDPYLRELGHMISGNLRHHRVASRYHGILLTPGDNTAGTTIAQTVIIQKIGTVHQPLVAV